MLFQKALEDEMLKLDCERLQRKQKHCKLRLEEDINDLVCDSIDKLIDGNQITCYESVDVAYYIANRIKEKFIIS